MKNRKSPRGGCDNLFSVLSETFIVLLIRQANEPAFFLSRNNRLPSVVQFNPASYGGFLSRIYCGYLDKLILRSRVVYSMMSQAKRLAFFFLDVYYASLHFNPAFENFKPSTQEAFMPQATPLAGVLIILSIWSVIAVLAVLNLVSLPSPPAWFDAWSRLIAAVAGTAIGARVLWSASQQLQAFLDRMK
jgi:hypothetical protein